MKRDKRGTQFFFLRNKAQHLISELDEIETLEKQLRDLTKTNTRSP